MPEPKAAAISELRFNALDAAVAVLLLLGGVGGVVGGTVRLLTARDLTAFAVAGALYAYSAIAFWTWKKVAAGEDHWPHVLLAVPILVVADWLEDVVMDRPLHWPTNRIVLVLIALWVAQWCWRRRHTCRSTRIESNVEPPVAR